jgi:hypothetical protein
MKTRNLSLFFTLFFMLGFTAVYSQSTLGNGVHQLEISGSIATYYNYRELKPGEVDKDKNRFRLRDAQIQLEGRKGLNWEYEFQFDLADIASGVFDPENPGLMDAYITYKGLKFIDIKVGYSKLAYSRSSITPIVYSAFWQRAEFLRGDLFSRRDVGITVNSSQFKDKLNIIAGIYNGIGEQSLQGDNDRSGALEYLGRIELGSPKVSRYRDFDDRNLAKPQIMIGAGARYTERNLPQGTFFPNGAEGEYALKVVDGEKLSFNADAGFIWKGFSGQIEYHRIKVTPSDTNSFLLRSLPNSQTNGYVLSTALVSQINYFNSHLHSGISFRYEDYNISDLVTGINKRWSAAFMYQIDGYQSAIKVQYFRIVEEEPTYDVDWNSQFRIGWQYIF